MPPRRSLRNKKDCETAKNKQQCETVTVATSQSRPASSRKRTRRQANTAAKKISPPNTQNEVRQVRRPQVISLDVTYSSSSEDSDVEEIIPGSLASKVVPEPLTTINVEPIVRNRREGRGILSSDSECEELDTPIDKPDNNVQIPVRRFSEDSDSDGDPYAVNFQDLRLKVFQEVKEICMDKKVSLSLEENIKAVSKNKLKSQSEEAANDSVLDVTSTVISDLDNSDIMSPLCIDVSSIHLKRQPNPKKNKKTNKVLADLKAFSKRFQEDNQVNKDDLNNTVEDVFLVEDLATSKIPVRVRWGMTYIKLSINKNEKFAVLYQHLAERYKASVSQVVLSFKDSVISPENRPTDIGLSFADIIEGGIINENKEVLHGASSKDNTENLNSEDLISLKVQTSNRKDSVTLKINKYDKLSMLMNNYAKMKSIDVSKLKFIFDGEKLEPSESAFSLDLDGGECIDVYEI